MFRLIVPITLIGVALGTFFLFTDKTYKEARAFMEKSASYEEALKNARQLKETRDALTNKYNTFSKTDLDKLNKILPDNVENIRLILDIQRIAQTYGMDIQNIKFDATVTGDKKDTDSAQAVQSAAQIANKKDYGIFEMQFVTTRSSYANFVNFVKDLEKSLRVVDVNAITFNSTESIGASPSSSDMYKYEFKIKTYWLKK